MVLAVVQANPLGDVTTAQRAVLQSVTAHLTAAYMTTRQEDDLRHSLHADHTLRTPWSLHRAGSRGGNGGPRGLWWAGDMEGGGIGKQWWGHRA